MTDVSRTYRRRYLKSIMCYQEDIGRTNDRRRMLDANLCENDPSTYFYCYYGLVCCNGRVALGQRVSEGDATNHADALRSRQERPPDSNGPRVHWPSWTVYLKRLGEDSTPELSVMVSARVHSLWATWMAMETSISWSATAFLVHRVFPF